MIHPLSVCVKEGDIMKQFKYRKTFTFNGKRYSVYADTQTELISKMADKLSALKSGQVVIGGDMTVKAWTEMAIEAYKPTASESTLTSMRYVLGKYLYPVLGTYSIRSIKPIQLQKVLNSMSGMSDSSIDKLYQYLKFIFGKARKEKIIIDDPSEDLVKPKGTSRERRSITDYEREHCNNVFNRSRDYLVFELMLHCGCRPEEAIRAIGKDIEYVDGKWMLHIRGTKTKNSDRYVPIPLSFLPKIKDTKPFEPICPNKSGRMHSRSSYIRLTEHLRRDLNIDMGCRVYRNALVPPFPLAADFVPYDFRHTYCTDLQRAGVDVRVAQKLMGHANIQMTVNIYTHVDTKSLQEAGELLEALEG